MGNNLANIEVRLQGPEGDVGVENRVNSTDDDMVGTSPLTTDVESNGGGTRPLDGHEAVRSGVQYPRVIDESSKKDEVRAMGVTCTGLHEVRTCRNR